MRKTKLLLPIILGILLPSILTVAPSFAANTTGLTAAVTATTGQLITGTVNANGFDIGVYVGPGVTGVVIKKAIITGANDHGILIQDTKDVVVKDSEIYGNGFLAATPASHNLASGKAILLSGTEDCLIQNNKVHDNWGGGIEITDDGYSNIIPVSPGTLNPGLLRPGEENVIKGNIVKDNLAACGIVVSSWYPGEGASENLVMDNKVIITRSDGPYVGGIVVAANTPNTKVKDNMVIGNTITGGLIPGIIIHANAPGDLVTGTRVFLNRLISNGAGPDPSDAPNTAGIVIGNEAQGAGAVLTHTLVVLNTVTNDYYGVWHKGDTHTSILLLLGNAVVKVGHP
jgi:parallel beta-helix repeat protein